MTSALPSAMSSTSEQPPDAPAGAPVWTAEVSLPLPVDLGSLEITRDASAVLSAIDDASTSQSDVPIAPNLPELSQLLERTITERTDYARQLTENILRYCYLRDRELVICTSLRLPIRALQTVSQFSSRFTIIGVVDGLIDDALLNQLPVSYRGEYQDHQSHIFIFSPFTNIMVPFISRKRMQFTIIPILDGSPLSITIGPVTEARSRRLSIASKGQAETHPYSCSLSPFSESSPHDAAIRFVGPQETSQTQAQPAPKGAAYLVYQGRDSSVRELLQDLKSLTQPGPQTSLAAHTLSERYTSAAAANPKLKSILEQSINEITSLGHVTTITADPLVLPDHIRSPEEFEYLAIGNLMSELQTAMDQPYVVDQQKCYSILLGLWNRADQLQRSLLPYVRPSLKRVEHRFLEGDGKSSPTSRQWIFHAYLTSLILNDAREMERSLGRQIALLRILNRLHEYDLALSYRLFTVRTEAEDLEAVFEVTCTVDGCDGATADSLRESFGELIHSAYVGIYGINFSFDEPALEMSGKRLAHARFNVELIRTTRDGHIIPFAGRPDWGYIVDYLRSLDWPTAIEMTVHAGTQSRDLSEQDNTALTWQTSDEALTALRSAISNIRTLPEALELKIRLSSDQPISKPVVEFVGTQISGGADFSAAQRAIGQRR